MDTKDFMKCTCGIGMFSCFGVKTFGNNTFTAATIGDSKSDKKSPVVPVDNRQMQNVLSFIDS